MGGRLADLSPAATAATAGHRSRSRGFVLPAASTSTGCCCPNPSAGRAAGAGVRRPCRSNASMRLLPQGTSVSPTVLNIPRRAHPRRGRVAGGAPPARGLTRRSGSRRPSCPTSVAPAKSPGGGESPTFREGQRRRGASHRTSRPPRRRLRPPRRLAKAQGSAQEAWCGTPAAAVYADAYLDYEAGPRPDAGGTGASVPRDGVAAKARAPSDSRAPQPHPGREEATGLTEALQDDAYGGVHSPSPPRCPATGIQRGDRAAEQTT